jgi:hypothetical protein
LVLAGKGRIEGPVLLWRGGVRKATDYKVRAEAIASHAGTVWDSSASTWSRVVPDFRRATEWMARQNEWLNGRLLDNDDDYDSGHVVDWPLSDSVLLSDTLIQATRIRARNRITVESGAELIHCKLLAPEIRIKGNARLRNSLAYASRNLIVAGGELQGGFFASAESLSISNERPLQAWPVFFVQGRKIFSGKADSGFVGILNIEKANGEGLFLSDMSAAPEYDQQIRLVLGKRSSVTGLLYCGGYAQIEGQVLGSVLCRNLRFEHKGTIWIGHLRDAQLRSFDGLATIPAPLLFPESPVMNYGEFVP